MKAPTCKSCKWWGAQWEGCCDFVDTIHSAAKATRFEIEATADDDSNMNVLLHTGPDFGCIHHSAKASS